MSKFLVVNYLNCRGVQVVGHFTVEADDACTAICKVEDADLQMSVEGHTVMNNSEDFRESAEYKSKSCVVLDGEESTVIAVDITDVTSTQIFYVSDGRSQAEWLTDEEDFQGMHQWMINYPDEVVGDIESDCAFLPTDCGDYILWNVD